MALDALANGAVVTSLSGALSDTGTTVNVTSAAGFPPSGVFRARVDDELIKITAGQGTTTWTVVRGVEATIPRAHLGGAAIVWTITEETMRGYLSSASRSFGPIASRPASPDEGTTYFNSDAPYDSLYTGGAWQHYGPRQIFKPLPVSGGNPTGFTQLGSTTGVTKSTANGKYTLTCPPPGSVVDSWRIFAKTLPALPFKVTACLIGDTYPADFWTYGLILRDSTSGRLANYGLTWRASNPGCTIESNATGPRTVCPGGVSGIPRVGRTSWRRPTRWASG
jgi:hypothetical protein